MAQPRQFIDAVKEALDAEYGFDLQKEVSLPKGQGFFFDLADVEHAAVVEIRPGSDVDDIEFTSVEFPPNSGEAEQLFGSDLQYFLVYETEIDGSDRDRLESILQDNVVGRLTVLDVTDIYKTNVNALEPEDPTIKQGPVDKGGKERVIRLKENATLSDAAKVLNIPAEELIDEGRLQGIKLSIDGLVSDAMFLTILTEKYGVVVEFLPIDSDDPSPRVVSFLKEIDHFQSSFFFALSEFDGEDRLEYFLENGVWQDGGDTRDISHILNTQIEVGDIIFLKSDEIAIDKNTVFTRGGGIVKENPENGKSLKVDWMLPDFVHRIPNMLWYNGIIEPLGAPELFNVLEYLRYDEMNTLIQALENSNKPVVSTIAGLISDADSGKDYLDITKDVAAFSRVIAAKSFIPPLAIALFGKWGSGKSFFMRKLREQIDRLADKHTNDIFCSGIAQVHFNAWSYMDSNLWASIVSGIFEGLQQYISEDTNAKKKKKEIEVQLSQKLTITNEKLLQLETEKQSIEFSLEQMDSEKAVLENKLESAIEELKTNTLNEFLTEADQQFGATKKITDAIKKNKTQLDNVEEFKKIVPEKYWKTPDQVYEQTKSAGAFLKVFFDKTKWWKNILWLILIIAVIVLVPMAVSYLADVIGLTNMSLPVEAWSIITVVGGLGVKAVNTYNKIQPLVASFWAIKTSYQENREQATLNYQQAQRAFELEIESYNLQLKDLNEKIRLTTQQKGEILFRLGNTLSTEALFSFIEKRSESSEYAEHLGIISTIRKDFEILSELFTDHHDELAKVKAKEKKDFKKMFERPLERIILYIDDLDRCPEERVVEVLEAVNLLMAFPLFVVVVGVDPRWVKNALKKRHALQFENTQQKGEVEVISPSAYMEKIFQVPFNLKSASDSSVKFMLKTLAETQPRLQNKKEELQLVDETGDEIDDTVVSDPNAGGRDVQIDNELNPDKPKPTSPTTSPTETDEIPISIESLTFSDSELELIQNMSGIIGSSPRAIKRFINIFRIIKAHEDYPNTLSTMETNAVLFLLALPIGAYKRLYYLVVDQLTRPNEIHSLVVFLTQFEGKEHQRVAAKLYEQLRGAKSSLLDLNFGDLARHYPLIKRFSYISQ